MYISEITYNKLNDLLTATFQMNSFADNIAYNLSYIKMIQTESIFHKNFAHLFPELADQISDKMLELNAKPIRGALNENNEIYDNFLEMFIKINEAVGIYRKMIIDVIDVAEYNDDYEIKIFLEDFLIKFLKYINQSETWVKKSNQYKDDPQSFDNHFEDFTLI